MVYSMSSDVLVFDFTYKSNKFGMPFAPFTSINHHWQSIFFGRALLEDETIDTFICLFKQFHRCMFDRAPVAIIMDQDAFIANSI